MYALAYIIILNVTGYILYLFWSKKKVIFFISIFWGLLGLSMYYRQGLYVDTIRFFSTLNTVRDYNSWSGISGGWQFLMNQDYSGVPVAGLYVLLLSLIKNNQVFNFVTAFTLSFLILGSILISFKKKREKTKIVITYFLFFMIYNFQYGIQNVRSPIVSAVSMFMLLWVDEKENSIRRIFIFYIVMFLATLMHPFALLIVFVFTFKWLIRNKKARFIFDLLLIFWTSFIEPIFENVVSGFNIPFFESISTKSDSYLGLNGSLNTVSSFDIYRSVLKLMILLLVYYLYKRNTQTKTLLNSVFVSVVCFAIGSINSPTIIERTVNLLIFLAIPYYGPFLFTKSAKEKNLVEYILKTIVILFFLFFLFDNLRAGVRFYYLGW